MTRHMYVASTVFKHHSYHSIIVFIMCFSLPCMYLLFLPTWKKDSDPQNIRISERCKNLKTPPQGYINIWGGGEMLSDRARVVWTLGSYENAAFVSLSPILESAFQWFSIGVLLSSLSPILLQTTPMMSAPSRFARDCFFGVMTALCLGQKDIRSQLPREKANTVHCTLWFHLLIDLNVD